MPAMLLSSNRTSALDCPECALRRGYRKIVAGCGTVAVFFRMTVYTLASAARN